MTEIQQKIALANLMIDHLYKDKPLQLFMSEKQFAMFIDVTIKPSAPPAPPWHCWSVFMNTKVNKDHTTCAEQNNFFVLPAGHEHKAEVHHIAIPSDQEVAHLLTLAMQLAAWEALLNHLLPHTPTSDSVWEFNSSLISFCLSSAVI